VPAARNHVPIANLDLVVGPDGGSESRRGVRPNCPDFDKGLTKMPLIEVKLV